MEADERVSEITMKGWLSKRAISGKFKNWRERFFVLKGSKLEYRKEEEGNARGSLQLDANSSVSAFPDFGETCFRLIGCGGTTLFARAKEKQECAEWVSALNLVILALPKGKNRTSSVDSNKSLTPHSLAPGHPGTRPMSSHFFRRDSTETGDIVRESSKRLLRGHSKSGLIMEAEEEEEKGVSTKTTISSSPNLPPGIEPQPPTEKDVAGTSVRELPKFAKFARMLKMHIPVPAVCMKMEMAGTFTATEIDNFRENKKVVVPQEDIPRPPVIEVRKVATESARKMPKFAKYARMLKMHIPVAAVCMKMEALGEFSADEIEAFRNDKACTVVQKLKPISETDSTVVKDRHANRGGFMLSDAIKFGAMQRKAKKEKIKVKRSIQRKLLGKLHRIRERARNDRLEEVKMRERRASVFRPVVALEMEGDKKTALAEPEALATHIQKHGIRTRTDALNYDKSLQGCPSGSRKASCVCRANPNIIFLYKRRHPAFKITREDVQNDIDLMKTCTEAGLTQLPLVYTDVFDAHVDDFETFGFLMGNVPSLMTAPYKPGTSHSATVNNIKGRLKLLNFTQLNRAIKDLEDIGKFTKEKYYVHDLQMLLQDEGPQDQIGHIWVIDPGELQKTKGKNQVYKLLKLCRNLKRQRAKSFVRFWKDNSEHDDDESKQA